MAGAVCFELWLDAGGVSRDRAGSADGYATAVFALGVAVAVLLLARFGSRLAKLLRRG